MICKGDGSKMVDSNHEDADSRIRGPPIITRGGRTGGFELDKLGILLTICRT